MAAYSAGPARAVAWSPHREDQVLLAGTGLRLFEVTGDHFSFDVDDVQSGAISNPPATADEQEARPMAPLTLLAANCHQTLLRSTIVDWYPDPNHGNIVAVGHRSGTVTITGVDTTIQLGAGLSNRREFSPRVNRPCSQIAWNPLKPTVIAVGLDRLNKEPSLLLWDVSAKAVSLGDMKRRLPGASGDGLRNLKPYTSSGPARTAGPTEMSVGEGVLSFEWLPGSQDILLAGIGSKWLRRFDIREGTHNNFSNARGAYSLTVDPNRTNSFASYSRADHQIKIWDMRQFSDPVTTIMTGARETVTQLAWSPTRTGLLAALVENETAVRLYDTHLLSSATDGPSVLETTPRGLISERKTKVLQGKPLVHFDWHPTRRNQIMTVTEKGTVGLCKVDEPVIFDVSPKSELCFGRHTSQRPINVSLEPEGGSAFEDISIRMRRRVLAGAGMTSEYTLEAYQDDADLIELWLWLDGVSNPTVWLHGISGQAAESQEYKLIGVRDALAFSEKSFMGYGGGFSDVGKLGIPTFESSLQRSLAIRLCGWIGIDEDDAALNAKLDPMENNNEFQRAAAIAIFHQNIPRAIHSLTVGANIEGEDRASMLSAAIALSGFSADANRGTYGAQDTSQDSLWQETCRRLLPQLPSPYLRCALQFLISTDRNYNTVIEDQALQLADRVGFACRYLPDDHLEMFMLALSEWALVAGSVKGLLVEGFSEKGMDIISAYVDATADVQTASILTAKARCLYSSSGKGANQHVINTDLRAQEWIESYRDLLDRWQLWTERAKFDVGRRRAETGAIPNQIYFRCTFCNKSVVSSSVSRGFGASRRGKIARRPITACSCGKPLPRCSICLMNLGTATNRGLNSRAVNARPSPGRPNASKKELPEEVATPKTQPFGSWFSWCQTCQHGGHAGCLSSWFKSHNGCPVADCSCKCTLRMPDDCCVAVSASK